MSLWSARLAPVLILFPMLSLGAETLTKPTFEEYLAASAVPREVIDRFLQGPSWAVTATSTN